jgi:hypothetical protein
MSWIGVGIINQKWETKPKKIGSLFGSRYQGIEITKEILVSTTQITKLAETTEIHVCFMCDVSYWITTYLYCYIVIVALPNIII